MESDLLCDFTNRCSLVFFISVDKIMSCSHYPYIRFLQKTGLNVGFFKISWFTTSFNRTFVQLATSSPKFFHKWFSIGVFVTIFLVPVSIILLFVSIWDFLKQKEIKTDDWGMILEPLVPGLNLPVSDSGYYVVTLAICSIVHEVGHALAALKEGVHISGVGFIVVFILPVAYVNLNSEHLSSLHPKRQLRIFCAGIWHNVVLSVAAYLFLLALPFLLSPIYELGRGVHVLSLSKNSKLSDSNGIFPEDKLVAINDCEVSDQESWHNCLLSFANKPSPGYCVTENVIHELDESIPMKVTEDGVVECCANSNSTHICFETLEDDGTPLQILQYSCLPGRPIIAGTAYSCSQPRDCPPGLHCVRPITPPSTSLLRIQRSRGNVIIFIGRPQHVAQTVQVSDYVRMFYYFPSVLPEILLRLGKYFVLFSSGLAVVNAVPCFFFDGNHIFYSLVGYCIQGPIRVKNRLALTCNAFGLILLAVNLSCLAWKIILKI